MKKIINGFRYDTETATKVAEFYNGLSSNDLNFLWEELYLTKIGNWFLKYDGGALSKYSIAEGHMRSGSKGIIPLSPDEAHDWLEQNSETEALEKYFGERIQEA